MTVRSRPAGERSFTLAPQSNNTQRETGIVRTRAEPRDPLLRCDHYAIKNLSTRQREETGLDRCCISCVENGHIASVNRNTGRRINVHVLHILGPWSATLRLARVMARDNSGKPERLPYLLRDRDAKFCPLFRELIKTRHKGQLCVVCILKKSEEVFAHTLLRCAGNLRRFQSTANDSL